MNERGSNVHRSRPTRSTATASFPAVHNDTRWGSIVRRKRGFWTIYRRCGTPRAWSRTEVGLRRDASDIGYVEVFLIVLISSFQITEMHFQADPRLRERGSIGLASQCTSVKLSLTRQIQLVCTAVGFRCLSLPHLSCMAACR